MKIRNLETYLTTYTRGKEIIQLGHPEDPFCKAVFAENLVLESYIDNLSNFAVNGQEQFYYEFLQNAKDEKADTFCVFYDQGHLLIINNGFPFSTQRGDESKGELYSFLAKGKSNKSRREDKIGSKGLGSKLLYDFLTDVGANKKGIRLWESLVKRNKGPIIFSWNSWDEIESLFDSKIEVGNSAENSLPLLAKIIYSYYPALPGEKKKGIDGKEIELFRNEELQSFTQYVEHVFSSTPNIKNSLKRGTMFYVPLGAGQYEEINSIDNSALALKLKVSGIILKEIKQICINGKFFDSRTKSALNIREISYSKGGRTSNFNFIYPTDFSLNVKSIPNFFQRFPVTEEQHNLSFIFDSEGYDIDDGRQRIELSQNNKHELTSLVEGLIAFLDKSKTDDPGTFLQIFGSIIRSKESVNQKIGEFVNEHVLKPLRQYCRQNVPIDKSFLPAENIFLMNTGLPLNPEDVGLSGYYWVDERLQQYKEELGTLGVNSADIAYLLENTEDEDKAATWINRLDKGNYGQLLAEIIGQREEEELLGLKFIKTAGGKVLSLNCVQDSAEIIPLINELKPLASVLKKCGVGFTSEELLRNTEIVDWLEEEVDKESLIESLITLFVSNRNSLDSVDKAIIVKVLTTAFPENHEELAEELGIFRNIAGEYHVPENLFADCSYIAPSGLLNRYQINESELTEEVKALLMQKEEVWSYVQENWEDIHLPAIVSKPDYKRIGAAIFRELEKIHSSSEEQSKIPEDLPVAWTEDGFKGREDVYFVAAFAGLSDTTYEKCLKLLERISDYTGVSTHVRGDFHPSKLNPKKNNLVKELKDRIKSDNTLLDLNEVEHLLVLGDNNSSAILQYFKILERNGKYELSEKNGKERLYYSEDKKLNSFLKEAIKDDFSYKYFKFPKSLHGLFGDTDQILSKEETLVNTLINDFGAQKTFIDLLDSRSSELVQRYLSKIEPVTFYPANEYDSGTFEYKVLNLAAKKDLESEIKSKILINDQPLKVFAFEELVRLRVKDESIEFYLSDLQTEFKGKSDVLESIKDKFAGSGFVHKYFQATRKEPQEIYHTLKSRTIDDEIKLVYLIAFDLASGEKKEIRKSSDYPEVQANKLLSQLFQKKLNGFPQVYSFKDFSPKELIHSEVQEFVLPEEEVPVWVKDWLKEGEQKKEKLQFLYSLGVQNENSLVLRLRKKLQEDERIAESNFKSLKKESTNFFHNTLKWASERFGSIEDKSLAFLSLQALVNVAYLQVGKNENAFELYQLVFSGIELKGKKLTFKFKEISPEQLDCIFYLDDSYENAEDVLIYCVKKAGIGLVYTDYAHSNDELKPFLEAKGIMRAYFNKNVLDKKVTSHEWETTYYKEWLKTYGDSYRIYITDEEVPFDYEFRYGEGFIRQENILSKAGGVIPGKPSKLFVRRENASVLHSLEEHKEMFFGRKTAPLLDLFKLSTITDEQRDLLENLNQRGVTAEQLENILTGSGSTSRGSVSNSDDSSSNSAGTVLDKTLTEKEHEILNKNLDSLLMIADKLTEEELNQLSKGEKMLKDLLEETEAEANEVTGYLGEKLILYYLQTVRSSLKIDHTAETKRTPEYDLKIITEEGEKVYIDVKTTIRSVRSSNRSVPFYIKDSQLSFIKNDKPENYFIFRIGLADLGLSGIVKEFEGELTPKVKTKLDELASGAVRDKSSLIKKNLLHFKLNYKSINELSEKSKISDPGIVEPDLG